MPEAIGFFSPGEHEKSKGLVCGQVAICGAYWLVDVTFLIDTGSSYTLLLDKDFLQICGALGWTPYNEPDVLHWIRIQPDIFEDMGQVFTIAGPTESIFRIKRSFLWLLRRDGSIPKRWTFQRTIYGTFSADFLNSGWTNRNSMSHWSLLGIDKLNEFQLFSWSRLKSKIRLIR